MVSIMQVTTADYEVKSIEPMKIVAKAEDENLIIRIFFIPINIYITDDQKSISPVVNAVVSVKTDKPRFGEPCTSSKAMLSRPSDIEKYEIVNEGGIVVEINNKEFVIKAKITNLNIFTNLRDNLGNPCVTISWVPLVFAKT